MTTSVRTITALVLVVLVQGHPLHAEATTADMRESAVEALKKAATYYSEKVATHGGYVYHYTLDLKVRWGEGAATVDQIWVQPPGTPTVGMAFLRAYEATHDRFFLDAAQKAAEALVYGQLRSGGWTNCVDFDPRGRRTAAYRNGKGRGKNNSSLDDGQTQSALRLLVQVDAALDFKRKGIHESAYVGLNALLQAQFPNGGFPQVWTGPVSRRSVKQAGYPDHDWRTQGRIKEYWNEYTLNDNVCGYVAETLLDAHKAYKDEKYKRALTRLGDFLILSQMPDPQPAWAQQYNEDMQPIWARKFEPAAIAGNESQETLETLLMIYRATGDTKYLKPIPRALSYLKRSLLSDGRLARYYELKSNKPLYMQRRGKKYSLTYDDSNLPKHYGWKIVSRLEQIEESYIDLKRNGSREPAKPSITALEKHARRIVKELNDQGRWVSTFRGERLVGQPKFHVGDRYLSSAVFSRNVESLSAYLAATRE